MGTGLEASASHPRPNNIWVPPPPPPPGVPPSLPLCIRDFRINAPHAHCSFLNYIKWSVACIVLIGRKNTQCVQRRQCLHVLILRQDNKLNSRFRHILTWVFFWEWSVLKQKKVWLMMMTTVCHAAVFHTTIHSDLLTCWFVELYIRVYQFCQRARGAEAKFLVKIRPLDL